MVQQGEGVRRLRCLFCFPAAIAPSQLLALSENFYVLAPVGQVIEGYLLVATRTCRDTPHRLRCFRDVPSGWRNEVAQLEGMIADFYADAYGAPPIFFEHGRGGGYDFAFSNEDYYYHPHLCAVPGTINIHEPLNAMFRSVPCDHITNLRDAIERRPYLYVHTPNDSRNPHPRVYVGDDNGIQTLSIKRLLVAADGVGNKWNWRTYPGELELERLILKFEEWYTKAFRRF